MNRAKLNRRYSGISTLAQLRAERDMLDYRIELTEMELRHDYSSLKQLFSFSYIMDRIALRFAGAGNVINGFLDGYYLVCSLFGGKKRRCRR